MSFKAYAEKRGGGTRPLFGRQTWKKRYFVIVNGTVSYFEHEVAAGGAPLKPAVSLAGATVTVDKGEEEAEGGRKVWAFEITFDSSNVGATPGKARKSLMMRSESEVSRAEFVAALVAANVKATGAFAEAAPKSEVVTATASAEAATPVKAKPEEEAKAHEGSAAAPASAAVAAADEAKPVEEAKPADAAEVATPANDTANTEEAKSTEGAAATSGEATSADVAAASTAEATSAPTAAAAAEAEAPASAPAAEPAAAPAEDAPGDSETIVEAPSVPKPQPPPGPVPPEVEAAAKERQANAVAETENLPAGWTVQTSSEGYLFYVDSAGNSSWTKPTA